MSALESLLEDITRPSYGVHPGFEISRDGDSWLVRALGDGSSDVIIEISDRNLEHGLQRVRQWVESWRDDRRNSIEADRGVNYGEY